MSFFEIFNPGERYLREEKDRQKMLVVQPEHGGGAPLGIDLDAGTAVIVVPAPKQPAEPPDRP
ncbi:MAG TPA: DUF6191 domain-containing protein [Propionibacteriaceae bacterium]|nr:DUF6191 domain-containing protein [Propionibacteriaceae bacterium]